MEYGIDSITILGIIAPIYLEEMLTAAGENQDLHIASFDKQFRGVNHYVPGSHHYYLCRGDKDPNIKIISYRDEPRVKWTEEDVRRANAKFKEMLSGPEAEEELRQLKERFAKAQIKFQEKIRETSARKIQ